MNPHPVTHGARLNHRLYGAAQVRELDRRAIAELGVPGYALMQRAAAAAFAQLQDRWPLARRIAVLCGPGNNGGDGYELARLARHAGMSVDLVQIGAPARSGDAVRARKTWLDEQGEAPDWSDAFARTALLHAEVMVDAIFGIGLARAVEGAAAAAIAAVNARESGQIALALDLPSGLDADSGIVHGCAVRADATISFIGRKLGAYTAEGPDHSGLRLHDELGLDESFLASAPFEAQLLNERALREALPRRPRAAHKGSHGHVLLIGGEHGMSGAILLAARAALRAGAGLVTVATRAAHAASLAAAQPEIMFRGVESAGELAILLKRADAVGIGPGLGQNAWSQLLWQAALDFPGTLVMDADALNLLAGTAPLRTGATVLTPHPGEAARLLGMRTGAVQLDRIAAARALKERYKSTVVLKGVGSLICGEQVALCPYGNPGMGVGGMGDVLTGILSAFIAQGLSPECAAQTAVLAHALAGDRAAVRGERGLIPSDLLEELRSVVNPC